MNADYGDDLGPFYCDACSCGYHEYCTWGACECDCFPFEPNDPNGASQHDGE